MRTAILLAAAALLGGGCSNDVCANVQGTCVALHIDGNGSVATVQINASGQVTESSTATGDVTSLPLVMPVRFHGGVSGAVNLQVIGSINGALIGQGVTTVQVIDGQHTTGAVILAAGGDKVDAGATGGAGGFGGGGTGGFGGGSGGNCQQSGCPSGMMCDATGACVPQMHVPLGGNCAQDGSTVCDSPGGGTAVCAPDNVCRYPCAANADCTARMPMTACLSNYNGPQRYCTIMCDPKGGGGCASGQTCVVDDYYNSITDCVMPDGKNVMNGTCGWSGDCASGYDCYYKAGQDMGTCWALCMAQGQSCTGAPAAGTCQVPTGGHFGVCCPNAMSCL
jgi:hypothetical protein